MPKTGIMDEGKKVIMTYNDTFLNSDCLFIEFDDVLRSPRFMLLFLLKDNESLEQIFDLSEFQSLSLDELYEWYVNRKHRYVFMNIPVREHAFESYFHGDEEEKNEWIIDFENDEYDKIEAAIGTNTDLNAVNMLNIMAKNNMVKNIVIYSEKPHYGIHKMIIDYYDDEIKYAHGDLVDVLKNEKITANTTFILSDMMKINSIIEAGLLNYSSIVIADGYGYNKDCGINIEELSSKYIFKIDFFDNFESYE